LVSGLRAAREEARRSPDEPTRPAAYPVRSPSSNPLPPIETRETEGSPSSPDREDLNLGWNVSETGAEVGGPLARFLAPLRSPLRRLVRFALGPVVERQVRMNGAQVRFDNELVRYVDERFDRMSRHYDRVLGLHGRRMEEIDERHLILQQELVRHVHDLVARIELTFEAAEQNHLYLEGMLRETREELSRIAERLASLEPGTK
ncbi:MAG: hypothetical protein ACRD1Z_18840, partial [Vicinamibacteria bacterium]